jgi:hypothetical protein
LKDLDLSLFREDSLTERIKLQFRAEFFNSLNHPTFDVPQATITSPVFAAVSPTFAVAMNFRVKPGGNAEIKPAPSIKHFQECL